MTAEPMAVSAPISTAAEPAQPAERIMASAQAIEWAGTSAVDALGQALREALRRDLGYAAAKRALDVFVAVVLLAALLPIFAAIAIAIRLDSTGPVLYRGERVGRHGQRFTGYKFRSMRADATPDAHRAFVRGLLYEGITCAVYKVPDDRRITRIGGFLRSTSLDELPQIWNVLRGEMSLVGPRPDVPYAVADYADWMHRRLLVLPGITGLWQVSGRSKLSVMEMYRLDLAYVNSASLLLDLRILLRTIPVVLSREGAR